MSRRQRASSASVAPGPGTTAVHPAFTRAGVFGMQRMSRMAVTSRLKRAAMRSSVRPAAIEITSVFSFTTSRISAITSGKNWGFTASTSTSAASATSRLLAVTAMPNCSARFCRVASVLAEPMMLAAVITVASPSSPLNVVPSRSRPPIMAVAIFPSPTKPIFMGILPFPFCKDPQTDSIIFARPEVLSSLETPIYFWFAPRNSHLFLFCGY